MNSGYPFAILATTKNETQAREQFRGGAMMRNVDAVWGIVDIEDNLWLAQFLNTTRPAVYVYRNGFLYGITLEAGVPADI